MGPKYHTHESGKFWYGNNPNAVFFGNAHGLVTTNFDKAVMCNKPNSPLFQFQPVGTQNTHSVSAPLASAS